MRLVPSLTLLLLVAAGPPQRDSRHERLMDAIERVVILPKGASRLAAYGRTYAFSGPNRVTGIYLLPDPPLDLEGRCELVLRNGKTRPCTRREVRDDARERRRQLAEQTPAGKRRWYRDAASMPMIMDGGCTQVTLEYDLRRRRVLWIMCNGFA